MCVLLYPQQSLQNQGFYKGYSLLILTPFMPYVQCLMFFQHRRKLNIIIFSLALLLHLYHDISLQVDYAVGLKFKKKKVQ